MESYSGDKYESDNLIWQLDTTFKKLAAICQKNAKLVDYINKKVDLTLSEWQTEKENFKKLTWLELDDSDIELDLDVIIPSPRTLEQEQEDQEAEDDANQSQLLSPITPFNDGNENEHEPEIENENDREDDERVSADKHSQIAEDADCTAPATATATEQTAPDQLDTSPVRVEGKSNDQNRYDRFRIFDDKEESRIDTAAADADPQYATDQDHDHEISRSRSALLDACDVDTYRQNILDDEGNMLSTTNVQRSETEQTELEQTVVALINSAIKQQEKQTMGIHTEMDGLAAFSSTYFATDSNPKDVDDDDENEQEDDDKVKHDDKEMADEHDKAGQTVETASKKKKKIKGKLRSVQQRLLKRKKQMEETEKSELEKAEKKKEEQRLRMQNAQKRKQERQQKMKQKTKKLTCKLMEIKNNNKMEKVNKYNEIKQKHIKAEQNKQKYNKANKYNKKSIKIEQVNNSEKDGAAKHNKRSHLNRPRRNSLSISISNENDNSNEDVAAKTESKTEVDELRRGDEDIQIEDEGKYFDTNLMSRLSGKFLHIPRIVRKSSSSDLYSHIEMLYHNTNALILKSKNAHNHHHNGNANILSLEEILRAWLKNTNTLNFKDRKHDKDVLLVVNRMIYFDLNALNVKCSKLLIRNLLLLSKNKTGLELLSTRYVAVLLAYYKRCCNEYFYKESQVYKSILTQVSTLLVRIFQNTYNDYHIYKNDKDYKKFKRQTSSFVLLNLYKSSMLIKFASIFKSISNGSIPAMNANHKVLDGMLSILIEIPVMLKFVNDSICNLIHSQMESTNCIEIVPLLHTVVHQSVLNDVHDLNKKALNTISRCFQFCTDVVNANELSQIVLTKQILSHSLKFYQILSAVFQHINIHFNADINFIFDSTKPILEFITYASMDSQEIQDLFRYTAINNDEHTNLPQLTLIHRLCNLPFYFILQRCGQNVLFPALIAITFDNVENLSLMKASLNCKHLQLWLKRNLYSDLNDTSSAELTMKQKEFATKIQFYSL
mmetsp:Transcript_18913/g.30049  ORF Transcript_18913/g.30049 Transcript_18913/m.30049 type:complete len:1006 (-) Transcript_18913:746-3763(-)|eukprot:CAMPEP_0197031814 /NCGR_PEP_ID=MMETSP1384-20130603/10688_1 /TAXON_ID=29189 /ORGANISM="Ammonia sp." /LENGTH=1005 /DNA_ID=CAMNT_0042461389 /DNA_START=125 /DNA_END=3142 /DNA_ORIENTATION=+